VLKVNNSVTRKEIADNLGITLDGVRYHVDKLKSLGLIKYVGPNKGGK